MSIGVDSVLLELGLGVELLGPARAEGSNSKKSIKLVPTNVISMVYSLGQNFSKRL